MEPLSEGNNVQRNTESTFREVSLQTDPGSEETVSKQNGGEVQIECTNENDERTSQGKETGWNGWLKRQGGVPNSPLVDSIFHLILLFLIWALLLAIFREQALPEGNVFNIFILLVLSNISGILFRLIKLPGLFGMLLTGIILRSTDVYQLSGPYVGISTIAREFALAIILTKAGLALDPEILKKKAFTVVKLSLLPCIGESIAVLFGAHYIIGMPWLWAILLGFVLSPISPAVVVPTLISLKERGYGEDKGIATLVIAASAIDDVFSIVAFGVVLKMIFSAGEGVSTTIINGIVDLVGGILAGLLWALVSSLLPSQSDAAVVSKRSAMLGVGGVSLVLGTSALNHSVIGTMGSITASLFANIAWCAQDPSNLKHNPVANVLSVVWRYTEPMLFAMVGAEIDLKSIPPTMIVQGLAVLAVGLLGRVLVCYLALFGTGLNMKETVFVVLAWLPKATVQAAISAQALYIVRTRQNSVSSTEDLELASWILNTAILSIVVTAPIGAIAINVLGSKLLNKKTS
ncbi:hypothetical protein GE061_009187 [Apolygus lucorum]|uniref:Cation/H+ exchanger transmembrane domain-containing protein n=1 Tax=Apolygus lucorum TaxID=248454 RepID=A0A8S9Y0T2_APOLU|nr:hypothetical protein GE061_009187 [Apolygus lucorum]